MKPDWKDAPPWAQWLAMDSDGEWHWFEEEPFISLGHCWDCIEGRMQLAGKTASVLKEPRP